MLSSFYSTTRMRGKFSLKNHTLHGFFVLVLLGILAFIPMQSLGFALPKITLLSFAAIVGMILILQQDLSAVQKILVSIPGRLFLLFVFVIFLSPLWSTAPFISIVGNPPRFEGVFAYAVFFALTLTGALCAHYPQIRSGVLRIILLTNILTIFYGLLQFLRLDPLFHYWKSDLFLGRSFSFLGQPIFLGQFILLTLPFVFLAWKKERKQLWGLLVILNLCLLLATASRAALLGMIVILIIGIVSFKGLIRHILRTKAIFLTGVTILVITVGLFSYTHRFSVPTQYMSLGARGVLWKGSIHMISSRPFGYGLETMGILSDSFFGPELYEYESLTTKIDRAHSKPLDLLLTLGLFGFLSYYGFLIALLIELWRCRKEEYAFVFLLSLIGFSVNLFFSFENIATHALFWLIIGMAFGSLPSIKEKRSPRSAYLFVILLLLSACMSAATGIQWMRARIIMEQGEQFFDAGRLDDAIRAYDTSIRLFPFDRQSLLQGAELGLLALASTDDEPTRHAVHQFIDTTLLQAEKVSSVQDGMIPLLYGWHAAKRNDHDAVEIFLARAQKLRPHDIVTHRIAMESYRILNDTKRMNDAQQKLLDLLPSWWNDLENERGRILRKEHPWLLE